MYYLNKMTFYPIFSILNRVFVNIFIIVVDKSDFKNKMMGIVGGNVNYDKTPFR